MPTTEPAYFTGFKNFECTRTPSGVLTLRFHTDGGPATFTGPTSPISSADSCLTMAAYGR